MTQTIKGHGGKRKGAGRPPLPEHELKFMLRIGKTRQRELRARLGPLTDKELLEKVRQLCQEAITAILT